MVRGVVEPDVVKMAISHIAINDPFSAFILYVGWNLILTSKIPEWVSGLRVVLEDFEKKVEKRKYINMIGKASGFFAKILPKPLSTPPANHDDLEIFYSEFERIYKDVNNIESSIINFFDNSNSQQFFEDIKEKFGLEKSPEALKLFIFVKDLIVDKRIFKEFENIQNLENEVAEDVQAKIDSLSIKIENNLQNIERNILTLDEGFYIITPLYFYFNKSRGLDDWKEGWRPRLEDVAAGFDYRRKVLDEIGNNDNFLIIGKSGYSKSSSLYRVIYEFSKKNYNIVASLDDGKDIHNPQKIVKVVEDLLSEGNVLVAIDDVHEKINAFEIIRKLATHRDFNKIKFVFTARLPEWNDILENKINYYSKNVRESIYFSLEKLMKKKFIGDFDFDEAEGFYRKFYPLLYNEKVNEDYLSKNLPNFYNLSNKGHPILFKYWLTGNGIEKDVEEKYSDYLLDKINGIEDETKLEITLFSCILDSCGVNITDKLAESYGIELRQLSDSILKYNELAGTWETMHPVWDIYFLKFWYSKSKKAGLNAEKIIKGIIDGIIDLGNEKIAYNVINGLTIIVQNQGLFELFESSIEVPEYISDIKNAMLNTHSLGSMWHYLEKYDQCISVNTNSINILEKIKRTDSEVKPYLANAYNNRGFAFSNKKHIVEAFDDFDKSLENCPNYYLAYYNRGVVWYHEGYLDEAIKEYNKSIKSNPNYPPAYVNRGAVYRKKGKFSLAIRDNKKAIEISPTFFLPYNNIGSIYHSMNNWKTAIEFYNKAIQINPNFYGAYINRGFAYQSGEKWDEAINDFNKAIKIDSKKSEPYKHIGRIYAHKQEWKAAIDYYSKAINIDPSSYSYYVNEGVFCLDKARLDDALNNFDKAIAIDSKDEDAITLRQFTIAEQLKEQLKGSEYEEYNIFFPRNKLKW